MGIKLFIVFDDNSTDSTCAVMAPYVTSRTAILIHAKDSFHECSRGDRVEHLQADCQRAVFNYARSQLAGRASWMGNFDVDEFLYTPKGMGPLTRILKFRYADYDRISITGLVFGSNNHSTPVDMPVIQAFTRCAKMEPALDFNGFRFGHKELYRPDRVSSSNIHDTWCWTCRTKYILPLASDIRMNHYQYKSQMERHAKMLLNGNPALDANPVRDAVLDETEEPGIQYLLPRLKKMMILRSKASD
jgi:hypothetical protein